MNNLQELDKLLEMIRSELEARRAFITEQGLNHEYESYLKSHEMNLVESQEQIQEIQKKTSQEYQKLEQVSVDPYAETGALIRLDPIAKIRVMNLEIYSKEGRFVEKRFDLPVDKKLMDGMLEEIGVGLYDEYFIRYLDRESVRESFLLKNVSNIDYENIYDLNAVAVLLQNKQLNKENREAIELAIQGRGENISSLELANLILQVDKIPYYTYESTGGKHLPHDMVDEIKSGHTIVKAIQGEYGYLDLKENSLNLELYNRVEVHKIVDQLIEPEMAADLKAPEKEPAKRNMHAAPKR